MGERPVVVARRTVSRRHAAQLRHGRSPNPLAVPLEVDKRPLPADSDWVVTVSVAPPDRLDVEYEGKSGGIPIRKAAGSINGRPMSVAQPNPVQHLLDPLRPA